MMSENQRKVIGDGLWLNGRQVRSTRTERDRRRLLFRSLAVKMEGGQGEKEANGSEITRGLTDEEFADVLDVLSHTQPLETMLVQVPEEFFWPVIKTLPRLPRLQDLRVKRKDLISLIELLLNFAPPEDNLQMPRLYPPNMDDVPTAIESLAAAFGEDGKDLDWERFELVISNGLVRAFRGT